MKRKYLFLSVICCALLQAGACAPAPEAPVKSADKIVIGAWVGPPPEHTSDQAYKDVADSGINTIYQLYLNPANDLEAIAFCKKYGIKYMVHDARFMALNEENIETMDEFVEYYKNEDTIVGTMPKDEPGSAFFKQLALLNERYKKLLPNNYFYVNLQPTYASIEQRDGLTYKEYIDQYIKVVKPGFVSYDHYPLRQNTQGNSLTEDYLWNYEVVANATQKANIPFWAFIQAMGYTTAGMTNRIPDSTADIRFQVYTSLAFGAKGIQYFCYWTPPDDNLAQFTKAMVDKQGKKTPIYDMVKTVNQEMKTFEPYYMGFKNVGVMTLPAEDKPSHMFMEAPLESWAPIKQAESSAPLVIGCFEDALGNKAMMLVNYTEPSAKISNEVTIQLKGYKSARVFGIGGEKEVSLKGGKYAVTLEPGEGSFVMLSRSSAAG